MQASSRKFATVGPATLAWVGVVECLLAGVWLVLIPTDSENVWFFGLSRNRAILLLAVVMTGAISLGLAMWSGKRRDTAEQLLQAVASRQALLVALFSAAVLGVSALSVWGLSSDRAILGPLSRITPVLVLFTLLAIEFSVVAALRLQDQPRQSLLTAFTASLLLSTQFTLLLRAPGINWPFAQTIGLHALFSILALGCALWVSRVNHSDLRWWLLGNLLSSIVVGIAAHNLLLPDSSLLLLLIPFVMLVTTTVWIIVAQQRPPQSLTVGFASLGLGLLCWTVFLQASIHSERVNDVATWSDQTAYVQMVRAMQSSNFQVLSNGNQAPLYPFVQVVFADTTDGDAALFRSAKQINIVIAMLSLPILFAVFSRSLSTYTNLGLVSIITLSLYAFKAGFFQVEVLFYTLSGVAFVSMIHVLQKPSVWTALWVGVWSGFAQLAKASELPAVLLIVAILVAQAVLPVFGKSRKMSSAMLKYAAIIAVTFAFITAPYWLYNVQTFGQPFYNVNNYYMWFDGWDATKLWFAENGEALLSGSLPSSEIPNLTNYLRDHTSGQILGRLRYGLISFTRVLTTPFSFFNYWGMGAGLVLLTSLANLTNRSTLSKNHRFQLLFSFLYFVGFGALFAWFATLASGNLNRYVYGLYIPFLFLASRAFEDWLRQKDFMQFGQVAIRRDQVAWLLGWLLLSMLLVEAWIYVPDQILHPAQWFGK